MLRYLRSKRFADLQTVVNRTLSSSFGGWKKAGWADIHEFQNELWDCIQMGGTRFAVCKYVTETEAEKFCARFNAAFPELVCYSSEAGPASMKPEPEELD